MIYMGLDVGTKRIGVALTSQTLSLVYPLKTISFQKEEDAILELIDIIKQNNVEIVVIGLPKNMNNTQGFATNRSIEFASKLQEKANVKVEYVDERLTSVEARNILINNNYSRKKRKTIIDSVAAALILETFMKGKQNENGR